MTLYFACQPFVSVAQLAAAPCACEWDEQDDAELLSAAIDQASDILTVVTDLRVHAVCTAQVRPVGAGACYVVGDDVIDTDSLPSWLVGTVRLRGPRTSVDEVWIDGSLLPSTSYGLIDDVWLQRLDGQAWPSTQNVKKNYTQVGTWMIKYKFGRIPDFITTEATIELACELMAAYSGKTSHLPAGVTTANIQGATVSMQDRAAALRDGADEQIPAVSRFLGIYAPFNRYRSSVWSPELEGAYALVEVEGPSGS